MNLVNEMNTKLKKTGGFLEMMITDLLYRGGDNFSRSHPLAWQDVAIVLWLTPLPWLVGRRERMHRNSEHWSQ